MHNSSTGKHTELDPEEKSADSFYAKFSLEIAAELAFAPIKTKLFKKKKSRLAHGKLTPKAAIVQANQTV